MYIEERVFKNLRGLGEPSTEFLKAGRINLKNHENYFEWLKNRLTRRAVVIFDDIHWSPGMQKAWREASTQQGVVFSIDFFKLGVVVFDTQRKLPPEFHYKLFLSV